MYVLHSTHRVQMQTCDFSSCTIWATSQQASFYNYQSIRDGCPSTAIAYSHIPMDVPHTYAHIHTYIHPQYSPISPVSWGAQGATATPKGFFPHLRSPGGQRGGRHQESRRWPWRQTGGLSRFFDGPGQALENHGSNHGKILHKSYLEEPISQKHWALGNKGQKHGGHWKIAK